MSPFKDIDVRLREAIERARVRYSDVTNQFLEMLSPLPTAQSYPTWAEQLEAVAIERRKAMEELSQAIREWSEHAHGKMDPELSNG